MSIGERDMPDHDFGFTEEQIRQEAYYNWVNRGCPIGDANTDWEAAIANLRIRKFQELLTSTPINPNTQIAFGTNPQISFPGPLEDLLHLPDGEQEPKMLKKSSILQHATILTPIPPNATPKRKSKSVKFQKIGRMIRAKPPKKEKGS